MGVLSLLGAAASLAQPLLTRSVLDRIGDAHPVSALVTLLVVLVVLGAAIGGLRDYLLQRTAEGLVLGTRRRLAAHLLRLPIAEYDSRRTGDLLSRVGSDTTLLRAVVTSGLFETVTGAVTVVGAGTAMVLLDPLLFGITLLGVALGLGFALTFVRRVRALARAGADRPVLRGADRPVLRGAHAGNGSPPRHPPGRGPGRQGSPGRSGTRPGCAQADSTTWSS
ncbi:ABC transporter transmembrane domain-containing protein [Micromonospora sp. WMMD967]|uniref:ABC transporter transmembrane domain-containing protein n=1 Tax=Micromonospora sp. WMMD967 TaxID=3016101 RepID=UPI0024174E78|nr:ABC transporter transmembrane domain-containing protein [Micromonospora sp. WMMD967]MDG4839075.1 ABC transporter transmembrane domain-containing protein [Micromonospora sp. WMMD967]